MRPSERRSVLVADFASRNGLRYGAIARNVTSCSRSVWAAQCASATNGSSAACPPPASHSAESSTESSGYWAVKRRVTRRRSVQPEQPSRVAADDLLDVLGAETFGLSLRHGLTVRPGRVAVRVVGLE